MTAKKLKRLRGQRGPGKKPPKVSRIFRIAQEIDARLEKEPNKTKAVEDALRARYNL